MKVLGEVGTDVLVDEIKKIRQSVKTNSEKLELISPNYIEGTYAEIKELMESGQLYPGAKYLIKDHKLHYNAENIELLTDNAYEILLTANTADSFGTQIQWRIARENIWQNASYSFEAKIYGTEVEYLDKEHTGVMWDISYDGKQYPFMPDAFVINIPQDVTTVRFSNHKTSHIYKEERLRDTAIYPLKDGKYLHIGKVDDTNYGQCIFASVNDNPKNELHKGNVKLGGYDKCCWLLPDGETYGYFDYEVIGTQTIWKRIILISKDLQTIDERESLMTISSNQKLLIGDTYNIEGTTYAHAGYFQTQSNLDVVVNADGINRLLDYMFTPGHTLEHNGIFARVFDDDFYVADTPKNIFNIKPGKYASANSIVSSGFFDTDTNKHILCYFEYSNISNYFSFINSNVYKNHIKYKNGRLYDYSSNEDITELISEKLQQPNIIQLEKDSEGYVSGFEFSSFDEMVTKIGSPFILSTNVLMCSEMSTVDQILPIVFEGYPMPPRKLILASGDKPSYVIPTITHNSASEISAPLVLDAYSDRMQLSQARFRSKNIKYLCGAFNAKHLTSMFEGVQSDDDSINLFPNHISKAAATADDSIRITQRNGKVIVKYEVNGEPKIETFQ